MKNKATVINGVTSADIELKDDGVMEITVWRNGKMVCNRELGPQVNYDD